MRRRRGEPGRTRWRLSELLAEKGITVSPYDLWVQEGGYRHRHWDLARWGSNEARWTSGKDPDGKVWTLSLHLCSWSRMTDCIKHGIEIGQYVNSDWSMTEVEHASVLPLHSKSKG